MNNGNSSSMSQKIIIKKVRSPAPGDLDKDIDFLCKSLGYFSQRDKNDTAGMIFRLLVKEACNSEKSLTSDEIANRLKRSRGSVVHHLNHFIASGIVIREQNTYRMRSPSLRKSMEEIRMDIKRIMDQMLKIADDVDEKLGHYYR
jgi:predicted transcriptional regulator